LDDPPIPPQSERGVWMGSKEVYSWNKSTRTHKNTLTACSWKGVGSTVIGGEGTATILVGREAEITRKPLKKMRTSRIGIITLTIITRHLNEKREISYLMIRRSISLGSGMDK